MQNFTLSIPTTLICGPGEFSRLGTETAAIGVKALLVTGRGSARKLGYTERAEKMLQEAGVEVLLFEKIEPNPRHTTCDEAAAIVRDKNIDVIVALGGGSAMDAAKAISAAAKSGKSCWDHCFHKNGFAKPTDVCIFFVRPENVTDSEGNAGAGRVVCGDRSILFFVRFTPPVAGKHYVPAFMRKFPYRH